uniref:HAP1 N-terminal domain-containing protein n=1 Tax=Steinernema glaseri TaxID=37863 RepID=A0A1I8A4D2_9BILA
MSTTEVLPPPSTSGGARCRQRFHSEGEADSLDSRRKRSFNKKRHDHKRSQHSHSAAKTIRRRAKRYVPRFPPLAATLRVTVERKGIEFRGSMGVLVVLNRSPGLYFAVASLGTRKGCPIRVSCKRVTVRVNPNLVLIWCY